MNQSIRQIEVKVAWDAYGTLYLKNVFGHYEMRQHKFDPIEVYVEGIRGSGWEQLKDTYIVSPSDYFYVKKLFRDAWKLTE